MKINFHVSRLANKYFFIYNLSKADPYIRESYNNIYLSIIGELDKKQRTALNDYKKWHNSFIDKGGERKTIISNFYDDKTEKDVWDEFRRQKIDSGVLLERVFKNLERPFSLFWNKNEDVLREQKDIISKNYSKYKKSLDLIFKKLAFFYGLPTPKFLDVYLIFCPIPQMQGGKVVSRSSIEIEISELNSEVTRKNVWPLLLHETIHACFEDKNYKKWLENFVAQKVGKCSSDYEQKKNIFRELITGILASKNGFLIKKYIGDFQTADQGKMDLKNINKKNRDIMLLRQRLLKKASPVIKEYFQKKKRIDEEFLNKIFKEILN